MITTSTESDVPLREIERADRGAARGASALIYLGAICGLVACVVPPGGTWRSQSQPGWQYHSQPGWQYRSQPGWRSTQSTQSTTADEDDDDDDDEASASANGSDRGRDPRSRGGRNSGNSGSGEWSCRAVGSYAPPGYGGGPDYSDARNVDVTKWGKTRDEAGIAAIDACSGLLNLSANTAISPGSLVLQYCRVLGCSR
jgi:hypothetical protein